MTREELKAEALINLGSEPAPKEWEKLTCIKEQMPSCIGGEVSLQRFVGTDICAWFVGIGGLWEPQSDYFRVSLPPAEGAEQIASDLSLTIGLLEAEIDSLKDAYKSDGLNSREYSSAILSHKTALKILKGNTPPRNQQQPTAEGAENIRQLLLGWEHYKRDHFRESEALDVEAILMSEYSQIAAQPQPTAEGAEAFLDEMELGEPLHTGEFYYRSEVLEAMNKFATLHAQRIAEKMVSERLREALTDWADYWNELETGHACIMKEDIDEYLKTRDSHE